MSLAEALLDLQELTRHLRRECPWDREQTARTIVPHTVEEAYEVADAALAGDDGRAARRARRPPLPGLLPLAPARGARRGRSRVGRARACTRSSSAAIRTSSATRRRGRPGASASAGRSSRPSRRDARAIFHDVPEALPALLQARKVQRRAAAVGYDWPDLAGPLAKVREEVEELEAEVARAGTPAPETEPDPAVFHELGDVLFTVVNVARRLERRSGARASRDDATVHRARRGGGGAGRGRGRRLAEPRPRRPGRVLRPREGDARVTRHRPGARLASSSTRAGTRRSRWTSGSRPAPSAGPPFRQARRRASTRPWSSATAIPPPTSARACCRRSRT